METSSQKRDLTDLNEKLFDLFDQVQEKKIPVKRADMLIKTAGTIINNYKTQIQAVNTLNKVSKTGGASNKIHLEVDDVIGNSSSAHSPAQELRDKILPLSSLSKKGVTLEQEKYAVSLGYDSRLGAITDLTSLRFEAMFENWYADKQKKQ